MDQSMGPPNRTKERLIFLVCLAYALTFIVNNGNILTGGKDERKYLQKECNDL